MGELQRGSSKLRRLRVFNAVLATLIYCARNAGGLFIVAWFPCLLASACRLALEWLIFAWPPRMPEWLLFNHFEPPTWLTALVVTPWEAMAWLFVLSYISDRNSIRGAVTTPIARLAWLRFELSPAVFVAATIFSLVGLADGMARFTQLELLVAAVRFFELSDADVHLWAYLAVVIRVALITMVMALLYPIAGHALRTGTMAVARSWQITRGNRLRLFAIFLLLTVVFEGLDRFVVPATTWLTRSLADPLSWTLGAASIRYFIDFPFNVLWIVVWAATVGMVLDALEAPSPSAASERPPISAS